MLKLVISAQKQCSLAVPMFWGRDPAQQATSVTAGRCNTSVCHYRQCHYRQLVMEKVEADGNDKKLCQITDGNDKKWQYDTHP